ncbi:unnamed protein product [Meloidogyne enterolobii]|uniref:Uncharacterized protein n=1 Tax=Meloidogyne enterolobii TaxID=390850 RepID=A0ACB1AX45_MELEN
MEQRIHSGHQRTCWLDTQRTTFSNNITTENWSNCTRRDGSSTTQSMASGKNRRTQWLG